eukprot:gene12372-13642_t
MGKDKCCVSGCQNRKGCPEEWFVRSHVEELKFHVFPVDVVLRQKWELAIKKALDKKCFTAADHKVVCSNHFEYGKPTPVSPSPSIFLTESDLKWKRSPHRRRKINRVTVEVPCKRTAPNKIEQARNDSEATFQKIPMYFAQITRDSDVKLFTGIKDTVTFKFLFDQLLVNANNMQYWRGEKLTPDKASLKQNKKGPQRKLSLEQEFLLTLMKLRLGTLIEEFHFMKFMKIVII